jgi:hypothetical protein
VHPFTLDLLRKMNFDVSTFRSKSWSEFAGPKTPDRDFVFTLCCGNLPGVAWTANDAHWGLPDPAAATGNEAEAPSCRCRYVPHADESNFDLRQLADQIPGPTVAAKSGSVRSASREARAASLRMTESQRASELSSKRFLHGAL